MDNPLKVSLENIIPLTEARDHFSQIVAEVQKDKLYVLTKGGKPAVAIVDVKYLEHITGGEVKKVNIVDEIKKAPQKVGLAPMIEHETTPASTPPPPPEPSTPATTVFTSSKPPMPEPPPPAYNASPSNTGGFKPAGFAAPQPPKPEPSKEEPPKPEPFKVEPPKSEPPKPITPPPSNPSAPAGPPPTTINNDIPTKPSAPGDDKIEIQFSSDSPPPKTDKPPLDQVAPDDKNPPAQYGGAKDDPDDMSID